jgi:hypothetical protein
MLDHGVIAWGLEGRASQIKSKLLEGARLIEVIVITFHSIGDGDGGNGRLAHQTEQNTRRESIQPHHHKVSEETSSCRDLTHLSVGMGEQPS